MPNATYAERKTRWPKDVGMCSSGLCRRRTVAGFRVCSPCRKAALANYYKKNTDEFNARRWLRSLYGMTLEQYNGMLEDQGGVCKICGNTCVSRRRLSVDHCHVTGKIRGLLCMKCNRGIGMLGDSPEMLDLASAYLRSA